MLNASYVEVMDGVAQFTFMEDDGGYQVLTMKPERSVDVRFIGPMRTHATTEFFDV